MMRRYLTFVGNTARAHWLAYLMLAAIWLLACDRVLFHHAPRVPLLFNVTPSLPYTLAVVDYTQPSSTHDLKRGAFVLFAFSGKAQEAFPGLKGQPFFKIVRGVAGDTITVRSRRVFINGQEVGIAKSHGPRNVPLAPIEPVVIPEGYYYMQGTSDVSFDSRYAESGLVAAHQVIAIVVPIF